MQACVKKLLSEGDMALWFTPQIEFLKVTLEEGFFNLTYDLRENEMAQMEAGRRPRLSMWALSPLPKRYCR